MATLFTPNMNLPYSTINVDSGLTWETNLNSALGVGASLGVGGSSIDAHNHSPGSGVQIQPTGLNINTALPFNNNPATALQSAVFTQQASLATVNALFVGTDGNLYFNDGNADPSIQITAGGVVNATSSGISSGTASASFVSSVLVVNAASNTPANIQLGSALLGNNSSGSKFLTLSPPSALAGNYTLTLPLQPASTLPVSLDSSGNFSTAQITTAQIATGAITNAVIAAGTIGSAQIATGGVATSNLANNSVTPAKLSAFNSVTSGNSLSDSNTNTSPLGITNQAAYLTCSGVRPVLLTVISTSPGNGFIELSPTSGPTAGTLVIQVYRNGSYLTNFVFGNPGASSTWPLSSINYIDFTAPAGSNLYSLSAYVSTTAVTWTYSYGAFVAYEL